MLRPARHTPCRMSSRAATSCWQTLASRLLWLLVLQPLQGQLQPQLQLSRRRRRVLTWSVMTAMAEGRLGSGAVVQSINQCSHAWQVVVVSTVLVWWVVRERAVMLLGGALLMHHSLVLEHGSEVWSWRA